MELLLDVRLLGATAVVLSVVAVVAVRRPDWLLPGGAALGVVLTRPSVVGEQVPVLGPVVLVAVAGGAVVTALRHRTRDVGVPPWPFALFAAAWLWLAVHRLLNPLAEPNLATSTVTVLVPVLAFYPVVRDRALLERTRTVLVGIVVVVAALTVVALVPIALLGPTATLVGTVPLGYTGGSALYLPGALAYGIDPNALLPRMLGLGREPGMGALVAGWAYFAMPRGFPHARAAKVLLLLGLLATQSTAGVGIVGVCLVLQAVVGRERFSPTAAVVAVIGGIGAVSLAVFDASFGLLSKVDSGGGSFSDRNQATADGLTALLTHPFTAASTAPLSSVNLVASIAVDGAPWFLLAGAVLLAPVLRARRRDPLRYGSLLVLVVMLTSQPLAGNAGVLLLAVISFYAAARPPRDAPVTAPEARRTAAPPPAPAAVTGAHP